MENKIIGQGFLTVIFCITTAVISKSDQAWSNNVNIIRIQNNGSQIRTIFLPKHINNTNFSAGNKSRSEIDNTLNNENSTRTVFPTVNTEKHKNDSFNMLEQNPLNQSRLSTITKHIYKKHHLTPNILKTKYNDHSTNRTLSSSYLPKVEIKINADKIGKCKYHLYVQYIHILSLIGCINCFVLLCGLFWCYASWTFNRVYL